eukprot:g1000.t1
MGDWGDDGPGQRACAAGMGAVADEINATQVFALGDNIYTVGIQPADGPDGMYRFKRTFEDVYNATSLQGIPFYGCLGNHDWHGNVTAQLAYTNNSQTQRWRMPHYWHNVTQTVRVGGPGAQRSVQIETLLFDSVIMCGDSDVLHANGSVTELKGAELPGPADPSLAAAQLAWLTERMSHSTADYLWVGAHYPVWAVGQDPPTGVEQQLRPLLNKFEAHYFNGHEHDLEHIVENGTKVNYICTGAGKMCCYDDTYRSTVPLGAVKFSMSGAGGSQWQPMPFSVQSGFTSYRVGAASMRVYFHAHNGTVLYATPPIAPRTKVPQPVPGPPGPFYPPTAQAQVEVAQ